MSEEWSSPDVPFRIETNCFGGNRRFHSWCKVQREVMQSIVFIFSIKNGSADVCTCNQRSHCVCQGSPAAGVDLLRRRGVRTGWAGPGWASPAGWQRPAPQRRRALGCPLLWVGGKPQVCAEAALCSSRKDNRFGSYWWK